MNPGEFSCASLVMVQTKAEAMWKDAAFNKHNKTQAIAAQAVLLEQTAEIDPNIEDPDKDNVVRVYWAEDCSDDVQDCTDECTITGVEAQATCKDYEITLCREKEFSVSDKVFRTSKLSREDVLAKQMAKALQRLDEDVTKTTIAKIDSFAGINQYTGGIGNVVGNETYIDASNLTPEIVGYLSQVAVLNSSNNPYMLDGGIMYQQEVIASYKQVQNKDAADLPMIQAFRKYYDLFFMNAMLAPDKKMFLIDPGAVAIVSKNHFDATPITISNGANLTQYSIESPTLRRSDGTALRYDVVYKTRCLNSSIHHDFKLIARFDVFNNPASICDTGNTGVLSFTCGVAP
jgi:hypothetical protein